MNKKKIIERALQVIERKKKESLENDLKPDAEILTHSSIKSFEPNKNTSMVNICKKNISPPKCANQFQSTKNNIEMCENKNSFNVNKLDKIQHFGKPILSSVNGTSVENSCQLSVEENVKSIIYKNKYEDQSQLMKKNNIDLFIRKDEFKVPHTLNVDL